MRRPPRRAHLCSAGVGSCSRNVRQRQPRRETLLHSREGRPSFYPTAAVQHRGVLALYRAFGQSSSTCQTAIICSDETTQSASVARTRASHFIPAIRAIGDRSRLRNGRMGLSLLRYATSVRRLCEPEWLSYTAAQRRFSRCAQSLFSAPTQGLCLEAFIW